MELKYVAVVMKFCIMKEQRKYRNMRNNKDNEKNMYSICNFVYHKENTIKKERKIKGKRNKHGSAS